MTEQVNSQEIEAFLRNIPNPVLLGVFQPDCPSCEELEEWVKETSLPDGVVYARVVLDPNSEDDQAIADLLEVEGTPSLIGFCQGEELARTSEPEELNNLLTALQECGNLQGARETEEEGG